jgi:hypothetical protein
VHIRSARLPGFGQELAVRGEKVRGGQVLEGVPRVEAVQLEVPLDLARRRRAERVRLLPERVHAAHVRDRLVHVAIMPVRAKGAKGVNSRAIGT